MSILECPLSEVHICLQHQQLWPLMHTISSTLIDLLHVQGQEINGYSTPYSSQ